MRHKIMETIEAEQLLQPLDRVVVGFSGGADSVSLLSFLWEERQELLIQLCACHINHNLRGEESERDQAFAEDFCNSRGIPIQVFSQDMAGGAKAAGESIELYSRRERYRILEKVAESWQPANLQDHSLRPAKIATAHTLSDRAETIIFNLARGTALKGLEGIPAKRGNIIRPLINCSRQEVEAYCRENELDFVTDSSNLLDDYTRNKIRHKVLTVLEEVNPAFLESVRRLTQTVRRDNSFINRAAQMALEKIRAEDGSIEIIPLLSLDPALKDRIAAIILKELGAEVSSKKMEEVLTLAKAASGAAASTLEVAKGKRILCKGGRLYLKWQEENQPYFEFPIFGGRGSADFSKIPATSAEIEAFPGKIVKFLLCDYEEYKKLQKNEPYVLKKSLDYDRIRDIAMLRQKKDGDSILLFNKTHTRALKKLFQEAGIPPEDRRKKIVLADSEGPVWVEGFGPAKRAALSQDSKQILIINIVGGMAE